MMAYGKVKTKVDMGAKESRHFKEQAGPSGSGKSAEKKWMRWPKLLKIYQIKFSGQKQSKPNLIHTLGINSGETLILRYNKDK